MTVFLVGRQRHHPVRIWGGFQRAETFHVGDVEHMQGLLEAHGDPPSVELDGEHRRVKVDLANGVVLLRVPQSQSARTVFNGCRCVCMCVCPRARAMGKRRGIRSRGRFYASVSSSHHG